MMVSQVREKQKQHRHYKDRGEYFLAETRMTNGRLLLCEGRTEAEALGGLRVMMNRNFMRIGFWGQ